MFKLKQTQTHIGKFICKHSENTTPTWIQENEKVIPAKKMEVYFMKDSKGMDLIKITDFLTTEEDGMDYGKLNAAIDKYYERYDGQRLRRCQVYDSNLEKVFSM